MNLSTPLLAKLLLALFNVALVVANRKLDLGLSPGELATASAGICTAILGVAVAAPRQTITTDTAAHARLDAEFDAADAPKEPKT